MAKETDKRNCFDPDHSIGYKEYWDEIASLAKEAKKRSKDDGEEISDVLHEMIDGHTWVIYTWAGPWVMIHTENEDAAFEQGVMDKVPGSYSEMIMPMTYYAMYEDVAQRLERED